MDVSERDFQTAVIDRSHTVPVVVDFWAEWCGPCRQLGPVLERAVSARGQKIELAKVDVDANPLLAEFVGAQPPAAVERFLDSLLPSEADQLVAAGDEDSLRRALDIEPTRADAALPLARLLLARGDGEQALQVLSRVPGNFATDGLAARIELQQDPDSPSEPLGDAFRALDAGDTERGLQLLIGALASADGKRDPIRRVVVGVLDELGVDDPLARESRRKLASALY
jgi:putative thioredoxin